MLFKGGTAKMGHNDGSFRGTVFFREHSKKFLRLRSLQTKLFLLNDIHKKLILKMLTRVLKFSFFLSGVKMMAGSINSKHLGGNLGFMGTDL